MTTFQHKTVLLNETVDSLGDIAGKTVVDCTLGGGGHTRLLLERVGEAGQVIAFDQDPDALDYVRKIFSDDIQSGRLQLIDSAFSDLRSKLTEINLIGKISGIIADIGVSSHQIDSAGRGFSFSLDGPLDMRMNGRVGQTAAEFLNEADEAEIANVIYQFGEEHKSRQIAHLINQFRSVRPFKTTSDLADLIGRARLWKEKSKKHPATKTFQALRIFINDELGELKTLIDDGFECLEVGGRFSIITFHSLEDRIVKEAFQSFCGKSKNNIIPRGLPLTAAQVDELSNKRASVVGDFPTNPSNEEVEENPRSRSAKLRTIQKTVK